MKLLLPKTFLKLLFITGLLIFSFAGWSQTYNQVTTTGGLVDGVYLIVGDGTTNDGVMLNTVDATPVVNYTAVTNPGATITSGVTSANEFQVTVAAGVITIYNASVGYVSWGRTGNTGNTATFYSGTVANNEKWTATVSSGLWTLANVATAARMLQWNNSSPRFAAYTSAQVKLKLYKKVATGPTLTLTPTGPLAFSATANSTATATQDVTITGSNLTPLTGQPHVYSYTESYINSTTERFEYSTDGGSTYVGGENLPITSGAINKTLKVRLKANQPAGTYTDKLQFLHNDTNSPFLVEKEIVLNATVTAPLAITVVTEDIIEGIVGTTLSFQVIASNSPTSFAIASGYSLPAGLSLNTTTGVISGTPTAFASAFETYITATNATGTSDPAYFLIDIAKGNQTITFAALANKQYGDADFSLTGTSISGLTVTYTSSDTNVATISGTTVTIKAKGTTNITASQGGDTNYNAATNVVRSLTVTEKALTITGLTANNKIQDGNTTATLSGTATLNGVIGSDDVTLTGTPTATFASSNVGNGIAVTVSGYSLTGTKAANYTLIQPTGLTANITALGVPVATAATAILSNGFTANWDAVSGATSYILNVYQKTGGGTVTKLTEDFDGFSAGSPNGSANGTDVSGSLDTYTETAGWSGSKVYQAGGTAKMGTGSAMGILTTPTLDLSADGGNFKIDFEAMAWSTDAPELKIYLDDVLVQTATGLNNSASYILSPFSFNLTGGTSTSIISIRGKNNSNSRFFLENLVVTQGGVTLTNVTGSPFIISAPATTHTVTGLNPENTYYYTVQAVLGANTSANSNEITVTTTATPVTSCTWNGTAWSNTTGPTEFIDAIIEGNYSATTNGQFTAKSLTINSGVLTIENGKTITLVGALNNTLTEAAVVIESNGNLLQTTNAVNSGAVTINRSTSPLKKLDYVLWSSPVANQNLLAFSPATLPNRFYTYNPASDLYVSVVPSITSFAAATGYLIRMPDTHPTAPTAFEGTFVGVPNNGNYSLTVTDGTYNAIGNPYPTTIDADLFIAENNIGYDAENSGDGLYFWRKTNNANTSSYATYTTAGGVANTGGGSALTPNGTIQVGQGFIVKATSASLNFRNAMKTDNHEDQFLKTAEIERNRIWLNVTGDNGIFSQTMVAYMTNATQGIDAGIDGRYLNDSPIAVTSKISNQDFAIQGRSLPFEATDIVALGFKTNVAGNYSFAIDHVDGLFAGAQDIYLRDAITGVDHDLKAGAYSFTSEAGNFGNRFFVVYTAALSVENPVLNANAVVIYKNDNQSFTVNSGAVTMASVKVFDIRGRLLTTQNNVNANQTTITAGQSNEVLMVQITSIDGATVTKKVVR